MGSQRVRHDWVIFTLYIKNPRDTIRKLLELISEFSKVTDFKINSKMPCFMLTVGGSFICLKYFLFIILISQQRSVRWWPNLPKNPRPRVVFLHVCVCAQSCPTLWDPMVCSPPGSSVHGILQARILEWVAISSSRAIQSPRIQSMDQTCISCTGQRILYHWATWEDLSFHTRAHQLMK